MNCGRSHYIFYHQNMGRSCSGKMIAGCRYWVRKKALLKNKEINTYFLKIFSFHMLEISVWNHVVIWLLVLLLCSRVHVSSQIMMQALTHTRHRTQSHTAQDEGGWRELKYCMWCLSETPFHGKLPKKGVSSLPGHFLWGEDAHSYVSAESHSF